MLVVLAIKPVESQATTVRLVTSFGPIDITLYDTQAPLTVANFLKYVNSGAFDNSFFHRSMPGFIIQGGGYTWNNTTNGVAAVPPLAPVKNEFSSSRSNIRGTIAMAKLGGNPDSATSQWFINLADNSSNLDNQNGGFTVFGQVSVSGMQIADAIAALSTMNVCGTSACAFTDLPVLSKPASGSPGQGNLVMIKSAFSNQIGPISFSPSTLTTGGTTTLSATATSGLPVSFSSNSPNVCTVNGNTVTSLTAGICNIAADQPGNSTYSAATELTQSIIIVNQSLVSQSDCLFNWAEKTYAQFFSPSGAKSATFTPYYYRYYAGTGNYLAVSFVDKNIYVLGPSFGPNITYVGSAAGFLGASGCQ